MAGVSIKMDFKAEPLRRWLRRAQRTGQGSSPMWNDIGLELVQAVQRNFDQERAGGDPWPALSPGYAQHRPAGKILTVSGRLRNSVTYHAGQDQVIIGTNVHYAAIHQFGGRTRPTVISEIPARPFLKFTDADWKRVSEIIAEHLLGR